MATDTFNQQGFDFIPPLYSEDEILEIVNTIEVNTKDKANFRRTNNVFAIRRFLLEVPEILPLVFTQKLKSILTELLGENYFLVKSIYFDKPADSNWYVAYHQDLTISVNQKIDTEGFGPWTVKPDNYAVQPPLAILEQMVTLRIHLDDTSAENGALYIIPESHNKGILRPELIDWSNTTEKDCPVEKGGIMLMKPLLLHSSKRTTNLHQEKSYIWNLPMLNYPMVWNGLKDGIGRHKKVLIFTNTFLSYIQ